MLVVRVRVLASSIEIDVSVSRTAALLGMKQLQDLALLPSPPMFV
jgi:hypothetical protein